MNLLLGKYEHAIDDKSRLTIPSKLRGKLGNKVYVSKGFEGSLEIRDEESFEKWTMDIMKFKNTDPRARVLSREIFANTEDIDIDSAGRIKLPASLVKLAGLHKEVYVIGVGNRLEIWDKAKYEKYQSDNEGTFEEVASELGAGLNE